MNWNTITTKAHMGNASGGGGGGRSAGGRSSSTGAKGRTTRSKPGRGSMNPARQRSPMRSGATRPRG